MTWPPDPHRNHPQKRVSSSLPITKRPASVWVLIVLLALSILFIAYAAFALYQDARIATPYADHSETVAGLVISGMGSALENGVKFLARVIVVPILLVWLVLLSVGLVGVLRGGKWSLILVGIFAGILIMLGAFLLYFGVVGAALIFLSVASALLITMNLPGTREYWR